MFQGAVSLMYDVDSVPAVVTRALAAHGAITSVSPTGSRARGNPGPLSDWDLAVTTDDFQSVRADLPGLLAPLTPITPHWDPLSRIWNYIFMLRGGMVVNLLFIEEPHVIDPPWSPSAETLQDIDTHFWDWSFWLVSKRLKGEHGLVKSELHKMFGFLLGPMGCDASPATVEEAWSAYLAVRGQMVGRFGVNIDDTLERETRTTLGRHGVFVPL